MGLQMSNSGNCVQNVNATMASNMNTTMNDAELSAAMNASHLPMNAAMGQKSNSTSISDAKIIAARSRNPSSNSSSTQNSNQNGKSSNVFMGTNSYPGYTQWTPSSAYVGDPNQAYQQSFSFSDTPQVHKLPKTNWDTLMPRIDATSSSSALLHHIPFNYSQDNSLYNLEGSRFSNPPLPLSTTHVSLFHHIPVVKKDLHLPSLKKKDFEFQPFSDLASAFVPEKEF